MTKNQRFSKKNKLPQNGSGFFGNKLEVKDNTVPSVYNNITYPPGGGVIPELKCLVCANNLFRLRTMENVGKRNLKNFAIEAVFGETFTERNFKLFACSNCGFQMHFSNKMSYTNPQNIKTKSKFKTKTKSRN